MILVDFNAVSIAAITAFLRESKEMFTPSFAYHTVLNSLRANNVQFRNEFGQMVLVCDARKNWRRTKFEHYKAHRKKDRTDSDTDWELIFKTMDELKEELRESFPYHMIELDGAEADDIIGVMAKNATEPTVIISNDKDFIQLHNNIVCQYRPALKKIVREANPAMALKELIIRGDKGDGVPNICSPGNSFVDNIRQKAIFQKKLDVWLLDHDNKFLDEDEDMKRRFDRNQEMIDLSFIPEDIVQKINDITHYLPRLNMSKKKLMAFFGKHKMRVLGSKMNDFGPMSLDVPKEGTLEKFF